MREFLSSRVRRAVIGLLLCASLLVGWRVYEACRPGDPARWKNLVAEGESAVRSRRFSGANRALRGALDEARKFGENDVRLADTSVALADLYCRDTYYFNNGGNVYQVMFSDWIDACRLGLGNALDELRTIHQAKTARWAALHPEEIDRLQTQAVRIYRQALPPNSLALAAKYRQVARNYARIDRSSDALDLYAEILAIEEKAHGANSPRLLDTLASMIPLSKERSMTAGLYERILKICRKSYGALGPMTLTWTDSYVNYCRINGLPTRALELQKGILNGYIERYGGDDVRILPELADLAWVYLDCGNQGEAGTLYRRGITIAERAHRMKLAEMSQARLKGKTGGHETLAFLWQYGNYLARTGRSREEEAIRARLGTHFVH